MARQSRVLLEDRISYRCLFIATRITRHLAPIWQAEYGLSATSWRVMAVIGRFQPISAKEVAARTSTDAFFMTRAIDRLVEQDYVERGVDASDRRKLSLALTTRGKTVHREIENMINKVEAELLSGLDTQQRKQILEALSLLQARVEELGTGQKLPG
jgi:DNA-binding MarR family transcriptional regulator